MHAATQAILHYFRTTNADGTSAVAPHLQAVSSEFEGLAQGLARIYSGPEVTAGLRKLLEARDCFFRAANDERERIEAIAAGSEETARITAP